MMLLQLLRARQSLPAGQVGEYIFGYDVVRMEHARGRVQEASERLR